MDTQQATAANENTELSALSVARNRIDAMLPRVSVLIFRRNDFAVLAESRQDLPMPLLTSPSSNTRPVKLDEFEHGHWDAFFVSHGLLYNFGTAPARVIIPLQSDVHFYSGTHPSTGEVIDKPLRSTEGYSILYPERYALFQVFASKQVDDWIRVSEESGGKFCASTLFFAPADADKPTYCAEVITEGIPIIMKKGADGAYPTFQPKKTPAVSLKLTRKYPNSAQKVLAEFTEREDELFLIRQESLRGESRQRRHS